MHPESHIILQTNNEPPALQQQLLAETCPHCHKQTAFEAVGVQDKRTPLFDRETSSRSYGAYVHCIRRCPVCFGGVFLLVYMDFAEGAYEVLNLYPAPQPQFNREGLSDLLQDLFEECLACYQAGHYRAAAIMLRRCLEQICAEAGITGGTLHHRLGLFRPMVQGMDERLYSILFDLKALGNDAAHADLSDFDQVGKREVHLAIEVFKKVLDSFYQTDLLLQEFQALKKQPPAH